MGSDLQQTHQIYWRLSVVGQVITSPLLILHFCLFSINPLGLPPALIAEYLKQFLPPGTCQFHLIHFDLSTDELIKEHHRRMALLLKELQLSVFTKLKLKY